jgi:hypothetical protein
MDASRTAKALGWFSIGLGLSEVLFGKTLAKTLGLEHRSGLLRVFGLREIAAGLGILASDFPSSRWLWARVAGDAMDLALLGTGLKAPASQRRNAWLALGNVAAITALDVYTARQLPA